MLNNPNRGYLEERSFYIAEHDLRVKQRTEGWLANTGNLVWDGVRGSFFCRFLTEPGDHF